MLKIHLGSQIETNWDMVHQTTNCRCSQLKFSDRNRIRKWNKNTNPKFLNEQSQVGLLTAARLNTKPFHKAKKYEHLFCGTCILVDNAMYVSI